MASQKVTGWYPYSIYSVYFTPFHSIMSKYPGIRSHFHADNIQIYLSFSKELTTVFSLIESCIRNIFFGWLLTNHLLIKIKRSIFFLIQNILIIQIVAYIFILTLSRQMTKKKRLVLFSSLVYLWTSTSLL